MAENSKVSASLDADGWVVITREGERVELPASEAPALCRAIMGVAGHKHDVASCERNDGNADMTDPALADLRAALEGLKRKFRAGWDMRHIRTDVDCRLFLAAERAGLLTSNDGDAT